MSNATLNLSSADLAYGDVPPNSNPAKRYVDWKSNISGLIVSNPKTQPFDLAPGELLTVFDGTRSTSIDGTTTFSITLSPIDSIRYRFTATAGTAPAFRTDRALTLSGNTLSVTVNVNNSVTLAITAGGGNFSAVLVGDVVFIPDTTTGDSASPFNVSNVGYWKVIGAVSSNIQLVRPDGESFSALTEVGVVLTSNSQLQAFSPGGVQVGDKVEVSAGFAAPALKNYEVVAVNPSWVEVISTVALANQTGIMPGAAGMVFYSVAKRFVKIFADQECVVRANGATDDTQRMTPWQAGDDSFFAEYSKTGVMWSLKILNRSSTTLNINVISVE